MYVPATSAQPAAPATPLAPIEITTGGSSPGIIAGLAGLGAAPAHVSFAVRRPRPERAGKPCSTFTGALEPSLTGRVVELQALGARGWSTLASTRTGRGGRFCLRYMPRRTGSERVRLRFAGDTEDLERPPSARPPERVSPGGGVLVRGRRRSGVRRGADEHDNGGRQQDAAVRHAGHAPLRGSQRAGARDRPRAVRGRARIRPHRSDQAGARIRRHGGGVEHALTGAAHRPPRWERSCRAWHRRWSVVECTT